MPGMLAAQDIATAARGGRLSPLPPGPVTEPALLEARVLRNEHIGDRYFWLRLDAPVIAGRFRPGQFVMLTAAHGADPGPVLPRPMAVLDWDRRAGQIDIVYGAVGRGTRQLTTFSAGGRMVTVGPLGRGFRLESGTRRVLLAGRGIGTCSLTALARAACRGGIEVVALDSARHPGALVGRDIYRKAGVASLMEVTDADGSSDIALVAGHLSAVLRDHPVQQIFTCGSARLFGVCRRLARDTGADLQVSLEAQMACGLGYCHGCSAGRRSSDAEDPLICRDGPVFRAHG